MIGEKMFFTYQGNKLYYKVIGQGKPVLAIHGLGCSSELMEGCLEPIFEKHADYKRIYLDLPGMGRSDANPAFASADAILEMILNFIETVISGHTFLLAGESYGGYLARGILAKKRLEIDGLLLICPVVAPNPQERILPKDTLVVREVGFDIAGKSKDFVDLAILQTKETYQRFEKDWAYRNPFPVFLDPLQTKKHSFLATFGQREHSSSEALLRFLFQTVDKFL